MIVEKVARWLIKGNELSRKLVARDPSDERKDVPFVEVKEDCWIAKQLANRGKAAITLGRIVILREGRTNPKRIRHELVHVAQWEKHGDWFALKYAINPKHFEEPAEAAEHSRES
jgi:hypothetical protein